MAAGLAGGVSYTLRGTSFRLHRLGYSPQVPVRRAAERDEVKIAAWRSQTWAKVRDLAAATGGGAEVVWAD